LTSETHVPIIRTMPKNRAFDSKEEPAGVVKLGPILGVRPGAYLTALYGIALCLLVFFLLFFPGLKNRGAYLTVNVQPGRASILVDGTFAGTAPGTVFVKNGTRKIEVSKGFYSKASRDLEVRGRIFATLLFPSRIRLTFDLEVSDLSGLTAFASDDFSRNPQIPQIVSDAAWAAYGIRGSATVAEDARRLCDFLEACAFSVTNEAGLAELLRAESRVASLGTFLSLSGFLSLVREGVRIKEKYENSPQWLSFALSRAHAASFSSAQWMTNHLSAYRDVLSRYYQANLASASLSGLGGASVFAGIVFHSIPRGTLVMGKDDNVDSLGKSIDALLPHPVSVEPFLMSETEVTNRRFEAFVAEVPEWRPSNRNALVQKGLVTDEYLSDWTADAPPVGKSEYPVTLVSHEAAGAFCQWLTGKIKGALPGAVARLPTEAEWEWAARGGLRGMPYPLGVRPGKAVFFQTGIAGPSMAGSSEANGYGLRDMMGNVWEWCADSFGPADYLLSSMDPLINLSLSREHPIFAEKSVRGGGWANQKELLKVYTRGSQPTEWCTPYLGFRVAVSRP
jgi:formylglycine-generating enzyme required for sulfatase activity